MEIIEGIKAFLLSYPQLVTAVSTAIIAISAVITAFLTRCLIRDNRNLAKVGTEPEVVAYLTADPLQPLVNFALANVGRGPAKQVEFELALEEYHYDRILLIKEPDRKPYGFLLQGEKKEMLFGDHRLFGESALRPFQVVVKWQNLRGKKFQDAYTLDVRQFLGTSSISSVFSPLSKIANSLAKIEKLLTRWKS